MGFGSEQVSEIPRVDLTGLQPSLAGGEQWKAARAAVAEALHSYGCFEAVYPSLSPELREEMFGDAVPELFSLPLESKLRLTSGDSYHGYIGQIPHLAYESLPIDNTASPIAIQDFTHLMWPEGNSTFSNTVVSFVKPLQELVEILQKMILESSGVEKYYDSFHKIDGLEIQTIDGTWVNVQPSHTSVTVLVGQSFQAWSNMRVRAPRHRVRMLGKEKRFSAIYGSQPSHNSIVKTPKELGDDDHPLLYKPFNYTEFVKFLYSGQ